MTSTLTDIELWNAFKKGDKEALGYLFTRYYPLLFQYGSKWCSYNELLEDSIQELFIEIWQSKSDTAVHSVKAYLLRAIRYKLFKALKNRTTVAETGEYRDSVAFDISHESFLIAEQDNTEKIKKVLGAINSLPARQKEIIYLKIYQELDYEVICEVMDINYQVARNLFSQAIKSLRKILTLLAVFVPGIITIV